jgi:hypothetical protein
VRWVRGHAYLKPEGTPDRADVDAAGKWSEGHAPYPGRSRLAPESATLGTALGHCEPERSGKSAEAIVAASHGGEGPNVRSRTGTKGSNGSHRRRQEG